MVLAATTKTSDQTLFTSLLNTTATCIHKVGVLHLTFVARKRIWRLGHVSAGCDVLCTLFDAGASETSSTKLETALTVRTFVGSDGHASPRQHSRVRETLVVIQ